jgi:hypothetical protein
MAVPDEKVSFVPIEILLIVAINVVAGVICYWAIQIWDVL